METPITEPVVQSMPVEPQKPRSSKLLIPLVALLAVAAYFAFSYTQNLWPFELAEEVILTPTPRVDSTANWKTFANTEYEFKYPPKYSKSPLPSNNLVFFSNSGNIGVNIENKKFNPSCILGPGGSCLETTIVKVGGKEAYKFFVADAGCRSNNVSLSYNSTQTMTIFFTSCEGEVTELPAIATDEKTIEAVLSTFKFTAGTDISGWKTYANVTYGFELKTSPSTKVTVYSHVTNPVISYVGDNGKFDVSIRMDSTTSLDNYFYLDFPQSGKATLAGQEAVIFKAPKGYCDGPGCGDPFVAYSTKYKTNLYTLVFYGDVELNSTEQAVLSSFKFTGIAPY